MKRVSIAEILVWLVAVVLVAGIVHISSILLLPQVAARNSYVRLSSVAAPGGFRILPASAPGDESLPFTDPGAMLAICRFDLGAGPFRIRVDIDNEALTSLSFHSRRGDVFHTLTDRAALRGRLDVVLGTAAQVDAAEAADTEETPVKEVRLVSPSLTGLVVIRAMASSAAGIEALKRRIAAAECRPAE